MGSDARVQRERLAAIGGYLDFVVIGFQKCGTVSAREWLLNHPGTVVPDGEKGIGVVSPPWGPDGHSSEADFRDALRQQPGLGDPSALLGVVDPTYALCDVEATAANLANVVTPGAKIIAFERPRVARAYSAWAMASEAGWDDRGFPEAIRSCLTDGPSWTEDEWLRQSYVEAGEYNRIVGAYERSGFNVIRLQMGDAHGLANALGVSYAPLPHAHRTTYPPVVTQEIEAALEELGHYYLERGEDEGSSHERDARTQVCPY